MNVMISHFNGVRVFVRKSLRHLWFHLNAIHYLNSMSIDLSTSVMLRCAGSSLLVSRYSIY